MKGVHLSWVSSIILLTLSSAVIGRAYAQDIYVHPSVYIVRASVDSDGLEVNQPVTPYSGRVDAVAINPRDENHVLAATNSGGLFESRDDGVSWRHVDSLPVWWLNDVHFIPWDPSVILLTASADFLNLSASGSEGVVTTSGGGIWISRDGGVNWGHPDSAVPAANEPAAPGDLSCPPKLSAYGVSIDQKTRRIFVATDCGVLFSDDVGVSWTRKKLDYSDSGIKHADLRRFHTVAALEGQGVVVGGRAGVWYSDDNGENWFREETGIGFVVDNHAAGSVPDAPGQGFMITFGPSRDRILWRTYDNGRTWSRITGYPPNARTCGGIAHVYASMVLWNENILNLWFGNSCFTYRTFLPRLRDGTPVSYRKLPLNWDR